MKNFLVMGASLLVFSFSTPSFAALIERDLFATGDGLLTFDTTSGREWLDLTQSVNLSFLDIEANAGGWLSLGFEQASISDVSGLYAEAGLTYGQSYATPTPDEIDSISSLMGLIGETAPAISDGYHNTYGRVTDGSVNNGYQTHVTAGLIYANDGSWASAGTLGGSIESYAGGHIGNWLFRATDVNVPEPSTLLLLSLGLFGIFGIKGNTRRRV